MKVILCNTCGELNKRYTTKCLNCRGDDLEFFEHEDPVLTVKLQKIAHERQYSSPAVSMLIVALVATLFVAVYYFWSYKPSLESASNIEEIPRTTASSPGITR